MTGKARRWASTLAKVRHGWFLVKFCHAVKKFSHLSCFPAVKNPTWTSEFTQDLLKGLSSIGGLSALVGRHLKKSPGCDTQVKQNQMSSYHIGVIANGDVRADHTVIWSGSSSTEYGAWFVALEKWDHFIRLSHVEEIHEDLTIA